MGILLLSLLYFAGAWYVATVRPFWLDEMCTMGSVGLPSYAAMLDYAASGADPHPPLAVVLTRFTYTHFGQTELSARLPAMLAMFGALACLYLFLRRSINVPCALFGACILALGPAAYYATEARGYALSLFGASAAALAWQRQSHVGLALALAIAISSHYYAVFLAPLILAAALVRDSGIRLPLVIALVAGYSPLLVYGPWILTSLRNNLSGWQLNPDNVASPSLENLIVAALLSLVQLAAPLLLVVAASIYSRRVPDLRRGLMNKSDLVLASALVCLPFLLFVVSRFATGVYFPRYAIAWNLGAAMLGAASLANLNPRPALQWVLVVLLAVSPLFTPGRYFPNPSFWTEVTGTWADDKEVPQAAVVYSDALHFMPLWRYAPVALQKRLIYIHDVAAAVATKDPVPEVLVVQYAPLFHYPSESYQQFIGRQQQFLLLSTGASSREWLPQRLRAEGYQFETLRTLPRHTLYRVSPPTPTAD